MNYTNVISDNGQRMNTYQLKANYYKYTQSDGRNISYSYVLSEGQNEQGISKENKSLD